MSDPIHRRISDVQLAKKIFDVLKDAAVDARRLDTTTNVGTGSSGPPPFANPMSDWGDLVYGGEGGVMLVLPVGIAGKVLTVVSSGGHLIPQWDDVDPASHVHDHTDISDWFDAVASVVALSVFPGTGITAAYGFGPDTIELALDAAYAAELIRDTMGTALVAGSNIDITVSDGADTITIDVEALTVADISGFDEAAQDAVGTILTDSAAIDFTYSDGVPAITADLTAAARTSTINFVIDGGGSTITTGTKGVLQVDFAGAITANTLLADQSGSITLTIKKSTYSGYPGSLSSIVASAKPTLSSAQKSTDATLTGWTTSFAAGDVLEITVDTVATVQRVTLALKIVRS